jgi:flavin-dependent dehydrogenase
MENPLLPFDLVVFGATPGGIAAACVAKEEGLTVCLLEEGRVRRNRPLSLDDRRHSAMRDTFDDCHRTLEPGEPFPEPELWFHDIYRPDGTPFDPQKIEFIKQITT